MFYDDYDNNIKYIRDETNKIIDNIYNYQEDIIKYIFYIFIIKIVYDISCQILVTKINIDKINVTFQDIRNKLKDGDLIFLSSNNSNGNFINIWSDDIVSHVGIVFIINNRPFIFESENNINEYDIISKKKTIVVKIGVKTAKIYHYILIILSFVCAVSYVLINFSKATQFIFLLAYIPLTIHSIYVYNNKEESKLDPELKKVALSTFLFSILLGLGQVI